MTNPAPPRPSFARARLGTASVLLISTLLAAITWWRAGGLPTSVHELVPVFIAALVWILFPITLVMRLLRRPGKELAVLTTRVGEPVATSLAVPAGPVAVWIELDLRGAPATELYERRMFRFALELTRPGAPPEGGWFAITVQIRRGRTQSSSVRREPPTREPGYREIGVLFDFVGSESRIGGRARVLRVQVPHACTIGLRAEGVRPGWGDPVTPSVFALVVTRG